MTDDLEAAVGGRDARREGQQERARPAGIRTCEKHRVARFDAHVDAGVDDEVVLHEREVFRDDDRGRVRLGPVGELLLPLDRLSLDVEVRQALSEPARQPPGVCAEQRHDGWDERHPHEERVDRDARQDPGRSA